jgi:hypothetical protein
MVYSAWIKGKRNIYIACSPRYVSWRDKISGIKRIWVQWRTKGGQYQGEKIANYYLITYLEQAVSHHNNSRWARKSKLIYDQCWTARNWILETSYLIELRRSCTVSFSFLFTNAYTEVTRLANCLAMRRSWPWLWYSISKEISHNSRWRALGSWIGCG